MQIDSPAFLGSYTQKRDTYIHNVIHAYYNGASGFGNWMYCSRGTEASPTTCLVNDVLDYQAGYAYNGTDYVYAGSRQQKLAFVGTYPSAQFEWSLPEPYSGGINKVFTIAWDGITATQSITTTQNLYATGILINVDGGPAGAYLRSYQASGSGQYPLLSMSYYRGSVASPAIVQDTDPVGNIVYYAYTGTTLRSCANITVEVNGTPSASIIPTKMTFGVQSAAGATVNALVLGPTGLATFATSITTPALTLNGTTAAVTGIALLGASSATAAKTTLGLTIGTNVQAWDTDLDQLAGLTYGADLISYWTAAHAAATTTLSAFGRTLIDDADASTARTTLGLAIGTNVQAYDLELTALASVTSAANALPYFTGSGTATTTTLSSFGRTLIDDADAATALTTLGAVIGTNVQAWDTDLDGLAGLTYGANLVPYATGAHTFSTFTCTAAAMTVLDDTTVAAMVTTLGGAAATGTAGSGLVYKTSPTLTTPNIGVATATSINLSGQAIQSLNWNTYTPTVANLANIAALGTPVGVYCRVGDFVHVIVTVNIDATTTNTFTSMKCTLPIATDLINGFHLAGFMNGGVNGQESGYCYADTVNDWAVCNFTPQTAAAQDVRIMFSYKI